MRGQFDYDSNDVKRFTPQVKEILLQNARHFVHVETAGPELDNEKATDMVMVIQTDQGHVAVRIRRDGCGWRDLTIRLARPSGVETEWHKIRRGFARWYLYGWAPDNTSIAEWIFVDLDVVRANNSLDRPWQVKANLDGTKFLVVPIAHLRDTGSLISSRLEASSPRVPRPRQVTMFP